MEPKYFTQQLLKWHKANPRPMPWLGLTDPYKIWVSEIILQQTRVQQGWNYYLAFVETFPTIQSLAESSEDLVLKHWEGLGYYSRARNIHKAANQIMENHAGVFPEDYEEIISLPGIGPYTAAAIASFAFGQKRPVVDGNVLRIVSRYCHIDEDLSKVKGKKKILVFLTEAMSFTKDAAAFNQAIMNFGALQCIPSNPNCGICKMSKKCKALLNDQVSYLPRAKTKIKKKKRYFTYLDIVDLQGNRVINRRKEKDIWQGLYELILNETEKEWKPNLEKISGFLTENEIHWKGTLGLSNRLKTRRILSHQLINAEIITLRCDKIQYKGTKFQIANRLKGFAFPKLLELYLQTNL